MNTQDPVMQDLNIHLMNEENNAAYRSRNYDKARSDAIMEVLDDHEFIMDMVLDQSGEFSDDEELLIRLLEYGALGMGEYDAATSVKSWRRVYDILKTRQWFQDRVDDVAEQLISQYGRYE